MIQQYKIRENYVSKFEEEKEEAFLWSAPGDS